MPALDYAEVAIVDLVGSEQQAYLFLLYVVPIEDSSDQPNDWDHHNTHRAELCLLFFGCSIYFDYYNLSKVLLEAAGMVVFL